MSVIFSKIIPLGCRGAGMGLKALWRHSKYSHCYPALPSEKITRFIGLVLGAGHQVPLPRFLCSLWNDLGSWDTPDSGRLLLFSTGKVIDGDRHCPETARHWGTPLPSLRAGDQRGRRSGPFCVLHRRSLSLGRGVPRLGLVRHQGQNGEQAFWLES